MPNYNDQIDPAEISSAIGSNTANIQRMQSSLDQLNSRIERVAELFGKMRDYTRDEVAELNRYKAEVKDLADSYRQMYGVAAKGMNDYSVVLKGIEDQAKKARDAEQKAIKDNEALRVKSSKLQEGLDGRLAGKKKKALEEELGVHGKSAKELRKIADMEKKRVDDKITQNRKIISDSTKEQENLKKSLEIHEKLYKKGQQRVEESRRQRSDLLEVASDLHLPGVSQAATIAKYARRGMGGDDEDTPAGGGGIMGLLSRAGGGLLGALKGTAIVGGGYAAIQGYKAYNLAHQMAPMARTIRGQMGAEGPGAFRQSLESYGGYGGAQNAQLLMQLNRALGGQAGAQNLRGVTDIANRYGLSREEVAGQTGAAFMAGMSPKSATQDLQKIMSEGVKAGMDRARITQFTSEVLNVQQEIFRTTGENNAQAIAEAFGQLMRASGGDERFLRGPASQAVRGIDQAIRGVARGQVEGPAAGTIFRAFGYGAEGKQFGTEQYLNAIQDLEGGLFGGKGATGQDVLGRINKVFDQYSKESGGDKGVATLRMSRELGLGVTQVRELDKIREAAAKQGGTLTADQQKRLAAIQEETKDPMERLIEIQSKMDTNLAKLAASNEGLASIVAIDQSMLAAQEQAVEFLRMIAGAVTGASKNPDSDKGGAIAAGLGAAALFAPGAFGKVAGAGAGAAKLWQSGATRLLGRGIAGRAVGLLGPAAAVGAAGYAGYEIGKAIEPWASSLGEEENKYGQKSGYLERGVGKAATYLPSWMGGITDEQYEDMYGQKTPAGAAPPTGGAPGAAPAGAAPRSEIKVSDDKNTLVTAQNTEALKQLTTVMKTQGGPRSNQSKPPRVGGRSN